MIIELVKKCSICSSKIFLEEEDFKKLKKVKVSKILTVHNIPCPICGTKLTAFTERKDGVR